MRVFLDTNVLVSAFASRGLCADLLELVLLEHDLILGQNVLREFDKALREKVRLPASNAVEVAEFVTGEATQIVDQAEPANVKADADDARVLGEALAGQAELFVTGDAALLKLAAVDALKIVSPRQFWEALHAR
ncbi:MAG: putative toxin-antitoxin system toxin component, PIN family [Burkholderiales bacterium]|nr:putative toxin-antitoxin system toxin component, PIN family [Burkholderiales bacterium]